MTNRFSSFVVFVAPFCFPSQHHRYYDLRFCVRSFSVIVHAITKPLPQRLWTSKHSVGSGSGPTSSVFKNCKFSFFSFLFFFFAESFRNFHSRNSRFTLCSCLFFCIQELPLCVLFFFFSSLIQLFCSLGLVTLRRMEVFPHHISLQKHFTDFQNCSFFKPIMNRNLLKLGFRTGWGGSTGCIMHWVPTSLIY